VEISRRVLGPDHPNTLFNVSNLAGFLTDEGQYAESEALYKKALEDDRRVLGPEDRLTLYMLWAQGTLYQREGKCAQAETAIGEAYAGQKHAFGAGHPYTSMFETDLALAEMSQGKFAQAEPLAREALEGDKKSQPDAWQRYEAEAVLGECLAGEKKKAEAAPLLREGYAGMLARRAQIDVPDLYRLARVRGWENRD
jgi:tetratricopeptide (TPR) repeat protein